MKLTEKSETEAARELVRMAKEQGLALTGPDGLLKQLTKTVIETAIEEEMTEHLGYDKHDAGAKRTANSRNGSRSKTVLTETTGPVEIDVRRDRDGSFEPVIVKKRQFDQCHRIAQRPIPARGEGTRSFPDRAGCAKVPVSGHPVTRSDRGRQDPMDDALEARFERICHHI